jgi:hypothetical protein
MLNRAAPIPQMARLPSGWWGVGRGSRFYFVFTPAKLGAKNGAAAHLETVRRNLSPPRDPTRQNLSRASRRARAIDPSANRTCSSGVRMPRTSASATPSLTTSFQGYPMAGKSPSIACWPTRSWVSTTAPICAPRTRTARRARKSHRDPKPSRRHRPPTAAAVRFR